MIIPTIMNSWKFAKSSPLSLNGGRWMESCQLHLATLNPFIRFNTNTCSPYPLLRLLKSQEFSRPAPLLDSDPVSMGKYGYERLSSGLAPVVRITEPVSMD